MCIWGTDKVIHVIRRNNDSIPDGWHEVAVDECIADYVQEMNNLGIITVGCCCGHFKGDSVVLVALESLEFAESLGYEFHPFEDHNDVVEHTIPPDRKRKGSPALELPSVDQPAATT